MNLYFRVALPRELLEKTAQVAKWEWFSKDELLKLDMNPSYDKSQLVDVLFGN